MKHAFGVDVGSGQTFENRTLIPAFHFYNFASAPTPMPTPVPPEVGITHGYRDGNV